MAINALQVAWLSRLADKKVIRKGDSILEFGPQDLLCAPAVVEQYGLRHNDAATVKSVLDEAYDQGKPTPVLPAGFYSLFGTDRRKYKSLDLLDPRSDWLVDCNEPFTLSERFDVVTNFGTAEHVFNIGALFKSVHDVLKPGGVALHVLPAFGDINHGFYNVHPTTYLDMAAANGYTVDDICYVDRWDIRNKILEENIAADFDFGTLPITLQHLVDRFTIQRKVVDLYAANYNDPKTKQYGPAFPGYFYDYCCVALRKNDDQPFRYPVQGYYGGGVAPVSTGRSPVVGPRMRRFRQLPSPIAAAKAAVRKFILPMIPEGTRDALIRSALRSLLRNLALDVTGRDVGLALTDRWASYIFKRVYSSAPPLDYAAIERVLSVVEYRVERLYYNGKLNATIEDLDPVFLAKVKEALTSDPNFVSFVEARYSQPLENSATRAKAIDDMAGLVRSKR